jgi:hypothetical protein
MPRGHEDVNPAVVTLTEVGIFRIVHDTPGISTSGIIVRCKAIQEG